MEKNPITKEGFEKLKQTLNDLKTIERIKIINDIKIAREYGDLKENAEYHAAKEAQYILEKKIKDLEHKIINAQIINSSDIHLQNKILFGSNIELVNLHNNQKYNYKIVGEDEADIKNNKISIKSPLARALLQKSEGDIINLELPNGIIKYKILTITNALTK
ncbi:MAG TPA: transcription elongation factor GreA [Candidatus Azoamicus sp.]